MLIRSEALALLPFPSLILAVIVVDKGRVLSYSMILTGRIRGKILR